MCPTGLIPCELFILTSDVFDIVSATAYFYLFMWKFNSEIPRKIKILLKKATEKNDFVELLQSEDKIISIFFLENILK